PFGPSMVQRGVANQGAPSSAPIRPPAVPGPVWERVHLPSDTAAREALRSKLLEWDMALDAHGEALQGSAHLAEDIGSAVNELCTSVSEQQRIQMSLYS
ncbi:hypothetical protein FOZ63_023571, partial [Perkinsus olseni]